MFNKVLIANRGEIACRIIHTLHKLKIQAIAIYSYVDKHARHVVLADEAYPLGDAPATYSYLNIKKIIAIAKQAQAEAIHPGYGFLSENAAFAQACLDANITFIGPPPEAISAMGSKAVAKKLMEEAGIPTLPGYHGEKQDIQFLTEQAKKIGFPILIKASGGGGGKGMQIVSKIDEFNLALEKCQRESKLSFGDSRVILEKYLTHPRHIEIQILADTQGNVTHLFERDCSLQRRHQKVIEEAPAITIDNEIRKKMGAIAIQAAKAIHYHGVGTIEFMVDDKKNFYFLEMNTRLQVEHPVTEFITGLDLVELQLKIAAKQPLTVQASIQATGHAIEARLYAENPNKNFLPATGKITTLSLPTQSQQCRIDHGIQNHDNISIYYDPLLAKIIAYGTTRETAIDHLQKALASFHLGGITTNLAFLKQLITHEDFIQADYDTTFIENNLDQILSAPKKLLSLSMGIAALVLSTNNNCWRLNSTPEIDMILLFEKEPYLINIFNNKIIINREESIQFIDYQFKPPYFTLNLLNESIQAQINHFDTGVLVIVDQFDYSFFLPTADPSDANHKNANAIVAPMPGIVTKLMAAAKGPIKKDQPLVILEAMKMETTLAAPCDGSIETLNCQLGDSVEAGSLLIVVKPTDL